MTGPALALAAGLMSLAGEVGAAIVPAPKEYRELGATATLHPDAAIVLGAKASPPERYAAERLQTLIERRFKRRLAILAEDRAGGLGQAIVLGQASTSARVRSLAAAAGVDLDALAARSESRDGFAIETMEGGKTVLIAGSNPRGVIYGANAFFDLLGAQGARIVFPLVALRDWPSIAWRGRAWYQFREHLRPDDLDAYARARLNWVDFRDGRADWRPHTAGRGGPFGIQPGFELDKALSARAISEAQRRGLFVYGTVFCGVKDRGQFAPVLKTFSELVALGVDGLWLSFDDLGAGSDMQALVLSVLKLGKKHGLSGRRVATVPPQGSYEHIENDKPGFNAPAAGIPGFAEGTWFFTRVPAPEDVESARRIGLKRLPAWWHNWPRVEPGFIHGGYVGASLRLDGRPAYKPLTPLKTGWGSPEDDKLRSAHRYTDTVMMWGDGPAEYFAGTLGLWAWDPPGHDWELTQSAIRAGVFGPAQETAVREYDARLTRLRGHFVIGKPSRLRSPAERPEALAAIAKLEALLKVIQEQAPGQSLLEPSRLQDHFLEPMTATLRYARKMAELDFPEYGMAELEAELRLLAEKGQDEKLRKKLESVRQRVGPKIDAVAFELANLEGVGAYAEGWKQRVASVWHWKDLAAKKHSEAFRDELRPKR